jgi:hypothetical protein
VGRWDESTSPRNLNLSTPGQNTSFSIPTSLVLSAMALGGCEGGAFYPRLLTWRAQLRAPLVHCSNLSTSSSPLLSLPFTGGDVMNVEVAACGGVPLVMNNTGLPIVIRAKAPAGLDGRWT